MSIVWPVAGWKLEGKKIAKRQCPQCIASYLPGTEKETPWHHDQAYYPVDGEAVVSIWMPVGRDIG